VAPTEEELKRREVEAARQLQQVVESAVDAERLRRKEEDHQNLPNRCGRVQKEILQMKMGDQNVFTTPQQNILVAKALFDTIEPMLAEDHAATPIVTRIKAMVTAAAIQHHQQGNPALLVTQSIASRQPSGQDRGQGSRQRNMDACSSINHNSDARNIIDGRRREREEEEQHRRDDEREHFGIYNNQQRHDD